MPENSQMNAETQNADSPRAGEPVKASSAEIQKPSDPDAYKAPEDFFVAEEYGESFAALKTAMVQGYDLMTKRSALDEYNKTLNTLKEAHADRVNIAQNYDAVVSEQQRIISECNAEIEELRQQQGQIDAQMSQADEELASLKHEQAERIRPLQSELAQRDAMLASAKDELKQVKAQRQSLDAFVGDSETASHEQIIKDIELKLDNAKTTQRAAQKALDAQEKSDRNEQKAIADSKKKLNSDKSKIERDIEEQKKKAGTAEQRIAFCNHVIENPEETESMRARIDENEKTAANMAQQIAELEKVHGKSVAASSKARTVVIIAIVVVVLIIALFAFLSTR